MVLIYLPAAFDQKKKRISIKKTARKCFDKDLATTNWCYLLWRPYRDSRRYLGHMAVIYAQKTVMIFPSGSQFSPAPQTSFSSEAFWHQTNIFAVHLSRRVLFMHI